MNTVETPSILGIPLNRIIAFAGPYISLSAGAVASWLLVHVHLLGLFHLQADGLATGITQAVILILTAGLSWIGQQQWLKGHHIELAAAAAASHDVDLAAVAKYLEDHGHPDAQSTTSNIADGGPVDLALSEGGTAHFTTPPPETKE